MGGNKKAKRAARRQNAENAKITAQNNRRLAQQERDNATMKAKQEKQQWDSDKKSFRTKAALDAQKGVSDERANLIRSSSKLLTDFEVQERTRLQRAKKGQGQVRAEDEAITGDARQDAMDKLALGEDYWGNRRQKAYDDAYASSEGVFEKDNGSSPTGRRPETQADRDAVQRGRDYAARSKAGKRTAPGATGVAGKPGRPGGVKDIAGQSNQARGGSAGQINMFKRGNSNPLQGGTAGKPGRRR